jgi:hypothetical protein
LGKGYNDFGLPHPVGQDASQVSLHAFVQEHIETGNTVISDGWRGYYGLEAIGYKHKIEEKDSGEGLLPHVQFSNLFDTKMDNGNASRFLLK